MLPSRHRIAAVALVVCALFSAAAAAAEFPTKPMRIVVPIPPGGSADLLVRVVGSKLQDRLGQPVVVENRAGAGSIVATEFVAHSPPDGHTILLGFSSIMLMPSIARNLGFDVRKDLAPITTAVFTPFVLVANPGLPARSVKEMIAYAKANPGKLNVGVTPGTGTLSHLAGEQLKAQTGISVVFVPYKGSTPGLTAVMSGEIQLFIDVVASAIPHINSGKVRALAVLSDKRSSVMPQIPTAAESGLPGYDANSWMGFFAPGGTPAATISKLQAEISQILFLPDVKEKLVPLGMDPVGDSPEQFSKAIAAGIEKWGKLIRDNGINIE